MVGKDFRLELSFSGQLMRVTIEYSHARSECSLWMPTHRHRATRKNRTFTELGQQPQLEHACRSRTTFSQA